MVNPSDHVETPAWDSPPYLTGNSIFGAPKLELSEELSAVSKPVYKDELPPYCALLLRINSWIIRFSPC